MYISAFSLPCLNATQSNIGIQRRKYNYIFYFQTETVVIWNDVIVYLRYYENAILSEVSADVQLKDTESGIFLKLSTAIKYFQ